MDPDPASDSVVPRDESAQSSVRPLPRCSLRCKEVGDELFVSFQLPLYRFGPGEPLSPYLTLKPCWLPETEYVAPVLVEKRRLRLEEPLVLARPPHRGTVAIVLARLYSDGEKVAETETTLGDEELTWQEGAPRDVEVVERATKSEGRFLCIETGLEWCCPKDFAPTGTRTSRSG